jgi:phage-related protein
MTTYAEKREAAAQLFAAAASERVSETSPRAIDETVAKFAGGLSSERPVIVPVLKDRYGLYGWCSDGVHERIRHEGGHIRYGWTIWEWPRVMLTAEFHAVWLDPSNNLFDITPKPHGETSIVFVPDAAYPSDFDFDKRPGNRQIRIYQPSNDLPTLVEQMAKMKPPQLGYEQRRAEKAGKSLEEWLSAKSRIDPTVKLIDDFLDACATFEAAMEVAPKKGTGVVVGNKELQQSSLRRSRLRQQIRTRLGQSVT